MSAITTLVLSGGVGGAELVDGLYRNAEPGSLAVVVNTGDDFEHLGFPVSPDIDTVLYTLADLADNDRGWGRRGETFHFMEALGALNGEDWFSLGDRDLATHVYRRLQIEAGQTLSQIVQSLASKWSVNASILPMSNSRVRTTLTTDEGKLEFQDYFVRRRCAPAVQAINYEGASEAQVTTELTSILQSNTLERIIIGPSNPWLSVDPILAVPGMRGLLRNSCAPVVAVSPIVGGAAVKGPTAKIMGELGLPISSSTVADHYGDLLDGMLVDEPAIETRHNVATKTTDLLMKDIPGRQRLAREAVEFADRLRTSGEAGV